MLNYFKFLIFCTFLILSPLAWGLKSDASQVADFAADHVSFNADQGTTIYAGHVKMTQGSTQLTANEVTVYKEQSITNKIVAVGSPAHYTTVPEDNQDPVNAFGDTITYYPQKQIAIIVGNGYVIQAMNSLRGDRIVYNIVQQTVVSQSPAAKDGKSLIILQPHALPGTKTQ